MRSKRNHKELWEQLKCVIVYGKQKRFSRKDIYDLMSMLELGQLAQDPLGELETTLKEASRG